MEDQEEEEQSPDSIAGEHMNPGDRNAKDDHLLQITDILGPIPNLLRLQWPLSSTHILMMRVAEDQNYIGKLPEDALSFPSEIF